MNIKISGGRQIKVDEIDVDLALLALFKGKIGVDLEIDNGKKGDLEVGVELPIGGLVSGKPYALISFIRVKKVYFV